MKILITGGSSGLGRAIVQKLKKDYNVFSPSFQVNVMILIQYI